MIADPTTYSIDDFIPFTAEVYLRLIERQNAAFWPLHVVGLLLGAGTIILAWRGNARSLAIVLCLAWLSVAVTFHFRLLTELTYVAGYIGSAFIVQALFILGCALLGGINNHEQDKSLVPGIIGYVLAGIGLIVFPLIDLVLGRGMIGAECFAIAPNPTVLTTLGVLLIAARPICLWLLLPIPVLWCALSGTIDWALDLSMFWLLPISASLSIVAAIWTAVRSRVLNQLKRRHSQTR